MISFIGSYHAALGGGALIAYVTVGALIPFVTSRLSGDDGVRFGTKSGQLPDLCLTVYGGLSETIQYGQGKRRMEEIDRRTRTALKR